MAKMANSIACNSKKTYQQPQLQVVRIQYQHHLLAGSGGKEVNALSTNLGADAITISSEGGSGVARSRGNDWFDEE